MELGDLMPSPSRALLVPTGWPDLARPIRPDISRRYLDQARRALEVGLYDAAVNYFWDLTVNDLRKKVEAYGIDIFCSVEDGVNYHQNDATLQDRWRDVQDSKLLSGCLKLNIISRTAFRHLSFALSVRNHESAAHPVEDEEELDMDAALNFIRETIKYVLSQDMPPPGFNLKTLQDNIKSRDLSGEVATISVQLSHLTVEQCDSAVGMMVSLFIGGTPDAKRNIQHLLPALWHRSSDEAKRKVGEKYARLSTEGQIPQRDEVFSLLTLVGAIGVIPTSFRRALFQQATDRLIDAHFSHNNFFNEVGPARQLAELGVDCPSDALPQFCEAFIVSYIGNQYGVSNGAQGYLVSLKDKFTPSHWVAMLEAIRKSDRIRSEMFGDKPFHRVQSLCGEMLPTLVLAQDKRDCEYIIQNSKMNVLTYLERI